jgi:putative ABC transport system ATP-binding protein
MLTLSNVTKKYVRRGLEVLALDDVSCEFRSGKFHILLGESGSGKSTLLMAAGSMMKPDSGEILFDGKNIYAFSAAERDIFRNRKIGFVFQNFHLVPYLTVAKNIALPLTLRKKTDKDGQLGAVIEKLRLSDRVNHYPRELSVGQQQRVAVARALAGNPEIILADEPTGNLDTENAEIIAKTLKDQAENGKTVIIATHEKSLMQLADKTFHIKSGKLDE